jgi:hypothetical protein
MKIRAIYKSVALGALVLLGFAGCTDREQKPQPEKPTAPETPRKKVAKPDFSPLSPRLKPEDAIIRVNGVDITKADYDRWLNLKGRLYRMKKRRSPMSADEESDRFMRNSAVSAIGEIVRRELMRQAAEKAGVAASEELLRQKEAELLENIGCEKEGLKSVCAKLGPVYGPALKASVEADAREAAYLQSWSTNSLTVVTDEELAKQKAYMRDKLVELKAKNAEAFEKAAAARKEIVEGNRMFADVAKERADLCPEQGAEWEIFELAELEAGTPLARWLSNADTGDISQPMDLDDGIAIVGVVSKVAGESSEHPGETVDMFQCVRVLFTAYDLPQLPEDDDEWRESMLDYRRAAAIKALGKELTDAANIEYPNGTQLFNVKKPKKGKKGPGNGKQNKDKQNKVKEGKVK